MTLTLRLIDSMATPDRCGNNRPNTSEPYNRRLPSSASRHHEIPDRAELRDR